MKRLILKIKNYFKKMESRGDSYRESKENQENKFYKYLRKKTGK